MKKLIVALTLLVSHQSVAFAAEQDCADVVKQLSEKSELLFSKVSTLSREYPQVNRIWQDYTMLSFAMKDPTCENYKTRLSFIDANLENLKKQYELDSSSSEISVNEVGLFDPESEFGPTTAGSWKGQANFGSPVQVPGANQFIVQASNKLLSFNSNGSMNWTQVINGQGGPVNTPSALALFTSYGKISFYDFRTGQLQKEIQVTDELGKEDKREKVGPFGSLSVIDKQGTLALTSNSGKVFFIGNDGTTSFIKLKCEGRSGECYFRTRVQARSDGLLAVQEGSQTILFRKDGTLEKTITHAWEGNVSLSEDGENFLVISKWSENNSRDLLQSILILKKNGEEVSLPTKPVRESIFRMNFVSQNKQGNVVFGATINTPPYSTINNNAIGLIKNGQTEVYLSEVPYKTSLSSNYSKPSFDEQGRILVTNLDGRFFVFNKDGVLQATKLVKGEPRVSPFVMSDGTVVVVTNGTLYNGPGSIRFYKIQQN